MRSYQFLSVVGLLLGVLGLSACNEGDYVILLEKGDTIPLHSNPTPSTSNVLTNDHINTAEIIFRTGNTGINLNGGQASIEVITQRGTTGWIQGNMHQAYFTPVVFDDDFKIDPEIPSVIAKFGQAILAGSDAALKNTLSPEKTFQVHSHDFRSPKITLVPVMGVIQSTQTYNWDPIPATPPYYIQTSNLGTGTFKAKMLPLLKTFFMRGNYSIVHNPVLSAGGDGLLQHMLPEYVRMNVAVAVYEGNGLSDWEGLGFFFDYSLGTPRIVALVRFKKIDANGI